MRNATSGSRSDAHATKSGVSGIGKASGAREKRPAGRPKREATRRCEVEVTNEKNGKKTTALLGGGRWAGFKAGMRAAAIDAGLDFTPAAMAAWRARGIDVMPPCEAERESRAMVPPSMNARGLESWVEERMSTQSPAKATRRLYLLPRGMANGGPQARERPRAKEQLLLWGRMAMEKKVRAVEAEGGLGMEAVRGLSLDLEVAEAAFEEAITVEATGLTMKVGTRKGAVLGPAAMANCACATCANARFEARAKKVVVVVGSDTCRRSITKGEEVLVHYSSPSDEVWMCPRCEKQIVCAPDCWCRR